MSFPLDLRLNSAWHYRQFPASDKTRLEIFARQSLVEVLDAINQQVSIGQWVESHLASRGILSPTSSQIEMAQFRIREMIAISLAFEHPEFNRLMEFVSRNENELFPDKAVQRLGLPNQQFHDAPAYEGVALHYLTESLSENLSTASPPYNKSPEIRDPDGTMRNIGLFSRYRGPVWDGELDYLVQKRQMELVAALIRESLIDEREMMHTLITCDAEVLVGLRTLITGTPEMGAEEASQRFCEMLRCAGAPSTHTRMVDVHRASYIQEQLVLLAGTEYLKTLAILDFHAILGGVSSENALKRSEVPGLLISTLKSLSTHIDDFYRHAAVAILEVPAGRAFSKGFTLSEFSRRANSAFMYTALQSINSRMQITLDQGSYGFDIKKALVLLVSEKDFNVEGLSSEQAQALYLVTGYKALLEQMEPESLAETLEIEIGL